MAAPSCVNSIYLNFRSRIPILSRLTGPWRCTTALSFRKAHNQSSSELSERGASPDQIGEDHNPSLPQNECVTDEPVEMQDPYTKPHKKCILCQHGIEPDYKNVQLLSQFVSPFTGRIYGRHITGLCTPMQRRIALLIKRSQKNGFMPYMFKETVYLKDPKLYDPFGRVAHVPGEET